MSKIILFAALVATLCATSAKSTSLTSVFESADNYLINECNPGHHRACMDKAIDFLKEKPIINRILRDDINPKKYGQQLMDLRNLQDDTKCDESSYKKLKEVHESFDKRVKATSLLALTMGHYYQAHLISCSSVYIKRLRDDLTNIESWEPELKEFILGVAGESEVCNVKEEEKEVNKLWFVDCLTEHKLYSRGMYSGVVMKHLRKPIGSLKTPTSNHREASSFQNKLHSACTKLHERFSDYMLMIQLDIDGVTSIPDPSLDPYRRFMGIYRECSAIRQNVIISAT